MGNFKFDKEEGLWVYWYKSGMKRKEVHFVNGEKEGQYRYWYKNGNKREEGEFKDGNKDDVWRYWDKNGELVRIVCGLLY